EEEEEEDEEIDVDGCEDTVAVDTVAKEAEKDPKVTVAKAAEEDPVAGDTVAQEAEKDPEDTVAGSLESPEDFPAEDTVSLDSIDGQLMDTKEVEEIDALEDTVTVEAINYDMEDMILVDSLDENEDSVSAEGIDSLEDTVPDDEVDGDMDTTPPALMREHTEEDTACFDHCITQSGVEREAVINSSEQKPQVNKVRAQVLDILKRRAETSAPKAKQRYTRCDYQFCPFWTRNQRILNDHRKLSEAVGVRCPRCTKMVAVCEMSNHWRKHYTDFCKAVICEDMQFTSKSACPFCPEVEFECLSDCYYHMEYQHRNLLCHQAPSIFRCYCTESFTTLRDLFHHGKMNNCPPGVAFDRVAAENAVARWQRAVGRGGGISTTLEYPDSILDKTVKRPNIVRVEKQPPE
ncbi:hypothetical protein PFISCL1PPCAC_4395, partial [Pristionchus fissidentatus]